MLPKLSILCLLALWVAAAAGCYPGASEMAAQTEVSFSLPLTGFGVDEAAVLAWRDWYDSPPLTPAAYDIGAAGQEFFMGFDFQPGGNRVQPEVVGQGTITVNASGGLITSITAAIAVSGCDHCELDGVVMYHDTVVPEVRTYSGETTLAITPGQVSANATLDLYRHDTGTIVCRDTSQQPMLQVLAAVDQGKHVRLPPATPSAGAPGLYTLEDIPLHRPVEIQLGDPPTAVLAIVTLEQAGQSLTVEFTP